MVGNKTMNSILNIAKQQNARVLLTGDINQHNSVERGDSLRIIQEKAGVKPATIKTIRRQKTKDYLDAVNLISSGDMEKGFKALNKFGAIKESSDQEEVYKNASEEYIKAKNEKKEVLVVATTHKQGKAVTNEIRSCLKEKNMLKGEAMNFSTFESVSYTEPVIVTDSKGVEKPLNLKESERYTIFNKASKELLEGDQLRITKNFTSQDKKRLNNGDMLTVDGFTKDGNIKATRGRTSVVIDKSQGHFTHGYYTTSPAATDIAETGLKDRMKEKIEAFKRIAKTRVSKMKDSFNNKDLTSIIRKPIQKTVKNVIRK